MKIGEILVQAGAITQEQLDTALRVQQSVGGRIGTNLVELGYVSESALGAALSQQLRVPSVSIAVIDKVPPNVIATLTADRAKQYRACPIRIDTNRLWMVISDPTNQTQLNELSRITRMEVRAMCAAESLIAHALEKHYGIARPKKAVKMTSNPGLSLDIAPAAVEVMPNPSSVAAAARAPAAFGGTPIGRTTPSSPVAAPPPPRARESLAPPPAFSPPQHTPQAFASPPAEQGPPIAMRTPTAPIAILGAPENDPTSIDEYAQRLATAATQGEIFDLTLAYLAHHFSRIIMLALRGGQLIGWRGRGDGLDPQAIRGLSVLPGAIPIVAKVFGDAKLRLGRGSASTIGALANVLGPPGDQAMLALPALCGGHPVGCLVAVGGREGVQAEVPQYQAVVEKLDYALQIMALKKRILD